MTKKPRQSKKCPRCQTPFRLRSKWLRMTKSGLCNGCVKILEISKRATAFSY